MNPGVLAWASALLGLGLGMGLALIPGVPGATVALLGLVAFAGLTGFDVVGEPQLLLAATVAVIAAVVQGLSPVFTSRAWGGSAGAATGAVVGAVVGSVVPLPGLGWLLSVAGALVLGVWGARHEPVAYGKGVSGAAVGCVSGAAVDAVGVLAIGGILAVSVFAAGLP